MTRFIRHWYFLLRTALLLASEFARAGWYFKKRALHDLALPDSDALTSKEKRRLKHYFYGTTYLSVIFCSLRGRRRNRRERRLFLHLSALACYFDDLVDAFTHPGSVETGWLDNPEAYGRATDPGGRALHLLQKISRDLPAHDLEQFRAFMNRVFNAETDVAQQATAETLALHCAEKGGFSVLLFRRALPDPLSPTEQEALFQFGFLIQLCDDIFDLWHDRQAGIATPAAFFAAQNDVTAMKKLFEQQVQAVQQAFARLPRYQTALAAIQFLSGITRVCLRHYEDLQKKHGTLPLDDRKLMVVDMEQWRNRMRVVLEIGNWKLEIGN
jgi:hypothetical protein